MAYFFKKGTNAVDQGKIWEQVVNKEKKHAHISEEYTPNPNTFVPLPEKPCNISPVDIMERSTKLLQTDREIKERTKKQPQKFPRTTNQTYGWISTTLVTPDEDDLYGKKACDETKYAEETIFHGHQPRFAKAPGEKK